MNDEPMHLIPGVLHKKGLGGATFASPSTNVTLVKRTFAPPEWYRLTIDSGSIRIEARERDGWVRGMATLVQILPREAVLGMEKTGYLFYPEAGRRSFSLQEILGYFLPHRVQGMYKHEQSRHPQPWEEFACSIVPRPRFDGTRTPLWRLSNMTIQDKPLVQNRGIELDLTQTFLPGNQVLRVLDHLAWYKCNTLVLHLVGDLGFRLPIQSLPRLVETGAWRFERGMNQPAYGGHYSKEEVTTIIQYAKDRGIEVIPALEAPDFAGALIASLPHLSCSGKPRPVPLVKSPGGNPLCLGKEATYEFFGILLEELRELFPGSPLLITSHPGTSQESNGCPHCNARKSAEGLRPDQDLHGYFFRRLAELGQALGITLVSQEKPQRFQLKSTKNSIFPWLGFTKADQTWVNLGTLKGQGGFGHGSNGALPQVATAMVQTQDCPCPCDLEEGLIDTLTALSERTWAGEAHIGTLDIRTMAQAGHLSAREIPLSCGGRLFQ